MVQVVCASSVDSFHGHRSGPTARMRGSDNQLVAGSAEFQLLTSDDLPAAWLIPVSTGALDYAALQMGLQPGMVEPRVVVELPDFPWAWKYHSRAQSQHVDGALPIMVVSNSEFRGQDEAARHAAAMESLRCLMDIGKLAPFFARIFDPRGR